MKIKIGNNEFTNDEKEVKDKVKLVSNDAMLNAQMINKLIETFRGLG